MFIESAFWGETFNLVSSVGWVVVASLAYTLSDQPSFGELMRYWMSYGTATLLSSTLMFSSNWLYFTGYRTGSNDRKHVSRLPLISFALLRTDRKQELSYKPYSKRRRTCGCARELLFWAQFFDFLGGAIYMAGSIYLMWDYMNLLVWLPGKPHTPDGHYRVNTTVLATSFNCTVENLAPASISADADAWDHKFTRGDSMSCRIFTFADLAYAIDAVLYIILWYRDNGKVVDPVDLNTKSIADYRHINAEQEDDSDSEESRFLRS